MSLAGCMSNSSSSTPTEHADTLLAPITLACKSKTPKIIGIAITALQRLVALGGVPTVSAGWLLMADMKLTLA